MAYDRNDRRYGQSGSSNYGGGQSDRHQSDYGRGRDDDRARSYGDYGNYGGSSGSRDYRGERYGSQDQGRSQNRDYGRDPRGYDYQDRGFLDRAGDEVRSWFGDDDAERRRRMDERYDERNNDDRSVVGRSYDRSNQDRSGYGASNRGSSGQGGYGANYGSSGGQQQGYQSRHEHDPHYRSWRDRQMESLDRDYDDYRSENQNRFETEFGSWRQTRQGQRDLLSKVQEHHEVVGSDGEHIGTVDHVRGDRIQLTKNDQAAGGRHHSIPCSWVQSVDDKVTINKTADQAKQQWRDEQRDGSSSSSSLFGKDDDGGNTTGNTNLNRSFSGTY
ncbi:DUF2171 domain-containing protein [uncultured Sphingomonas sp.]|uniref:DUF2171 domain-containing protein n=1 Tax=uncultured Sphingomonas sp. TaxID=158754 RepID=UPI0025E32949|nr:DUF2171 domain-containing protein [uncultured Sphingomonas sp.]